jgi:hypothetical protein
VKLILVIVSSLLGSVGICSRGINIVLTLESWTHGSIRRKMLEISFGFGVRGPCSAFAAMQPTLLILYRIIVPF